MTGVIARWRCAYEVSSRSTSTVCCRRGQSFALIWNHASHRGDACSALTDIAKSIAVYLHDETSPHRSLAIDLCSRGFQVWQQYVDAVEMLRALFTLATTTKKEAIAVHNVGALARAASVFIS